MKTRDIIKRDLKKNFPVYFMLLPVLIYYIAFCYKPMYGLIIAFKNFNPNLGILGSPWVGLKHFRTFFEGFYFKRTLLNTLENKLFKSYFRLPGADYTCAFDKRTEKYKICKGCADNQLSSALFVNCRCVRNDKELCA